MRQSIVILALTTAPALAAAQASAGAKTETRAEAAVTVERGESPRIPGGYSADARARLEAMFETARRKSLPSDPMNDRMAEGQAKGASESRIVAALATTLAQLELSQSALIRAGSERPSDAAVAFGAEVLARGAALETLTGLTARGIPVDRALTVIAGATLASGLRLGGARKP